MKSLSLGAALAALLCVVVATAVIASAEEQHVLMTRTAESVPPGWKLVSKADASSPVTFTVALRQRNLAKVEEMFWDVSNPDSRNYGKYLSSFELGALISPSDEVFQKVQSWLAFHGVTRVFRGLDTLKVTTTVQQAEKIFGTEFFNFLHAEKSKSVIRHVGQVHIPASLKEHVEMVFGLSEFFTDTKYEPQYHNYEHNAPRPTSSFAAEPTAPPTSNLRDNQQQQQESEKPLTASDPLIIPSLLRKFYNVPADLVNQAGNNSQSIAAFTDYYSAGALVSFETAFGLPHSNIVSTGPDCLPDCDQGESDLDVQYVTAMGRNVPTYFMNHAAGYWILEWLDQLSSMSRVPLVHSVSYGWPELQQCQIASTNCDSLSYDSAQYVQRVNVEFQKLGLRGVTVLVSDGDDGAPGLGGVSGNCPIDVSRYCPTGGCQYSSTQCGMLTMRKGSTSCFFPIGLGSDGCAEVLQDNKAINAALQQFFSSNSRCSATLDEDSRQGYHIHTTCSCSSLVSTTTQGITISGYQYQQSGGPSLNADFPTSSPYVTSVGATQFIPKTFGGYNEVAASIVTGAIITTGGGFSQLTSQPSFQASVVEKFLNSSGQLPPSNTFNGKLRGYPDISFNGHHYSIYMAKNGGDQCPCEQLAVDGTSCSSPALAGLLALLNDYLLSNNRPALGYVNQLLYKMSDEQPNTFNDIVEGDNKCNRQWCCEWGYEATTGWDPVTGLGSPNFGNMKNYLQNMHGL